MDKIYQAYLWNPITEQWQRDAGFDSVEEFLAYVKNRLPLLRQDCKFQLKHVKTWTTQAEVSQ